MAIEDSILRTSKPGTLSTKHQTRGTPSYVTAPQLNEMPHIYVHQKQPGAAGGGLLKPTMQQSAEGSSKREKYQMIGRPYRVKTKLPFYDARGVYQGVKIGQLNGNNNPGHNQNQKKLQQFEAAYSTSATHQQNAIGKKSRSISQVQNSL